VIDKGYVLSMAHYNTWQNRQLADIFGQMNEAEVIRDRGAFFGSIFGTVNHLLWGDTIWMSRWCRDIERPTGGIPESPHLTPTLGAWSAERFRLDGRILIWAETLRNIDLRGPLSWYSGALKADVTRPLDLCVVHMFNHQTHHRGQIHAMLTQAGATPPVSDLFAMPEPV